MAESLGSAVLTVSVDDNQFTAGLNAARGKATAVAGQINRAFDGVGASLRNLAALSGIVGIGALTQQIAQTGQESERSKIQLKALAGAYGETRQAAEAAARAQQLLGLSTLDARKGFVQLFGGLRGAGIGVKELEVLFVGITKAARLSGAGTQEANAAFIQLKQGLASGKLAGDELRSVLEQLPALGQELATQLGTNIGSLRDLGAEGKITVDVIFNALKNLASAAVPPRSQVEQIGIAFTNAKEAAAEAFGPALTGLLTTVTAGLIAFKEFVQANKEELVLFGRSILGIAKTLAPLLVGIAAVRAGFAAYAAAVNAARLAQAGLLALSGPKGWLALAAGIGITAVAADQLGKAIKGVKGVTERTKNEAAKAAEEFTKLLANTSLTPKSNAGNDLTDKAKEVGKTLTDAAKETAETLIDAFNKVTEARGILAGIEASPDRGLNQFLSPEQRQLRLNNAIYSRRDDVERAIAIGSNILKEQGLSLNKGVIDKLRVIVNGASNQRFNFGSINGQPVNGFVDPTGTIENFQYVDNFINSVLQENQARTNLQTASANLAEVNNLLATSNQELASQVLALAQKDWQVYVNVPGGSAAGDVVDAVAGLR